MNYLQIVLSSIFAVIVLFLLSKLIGARQISQMSMFDYINGITIGSIAAEAAISKGQDVLEPMAAMIIFGLATLLLSVAADKSIVLRRFITGRPVFLMKRGKLFKESMKKAKVDMSELQTMCRNQGYFDLSQIESIIFEPNGTVSISLPVAAGYDSANLAVYRLADGGKVLVRGAVEDGYYTVITRTAGTYALVEKGSTITDAENTANIPQTGDDSIVAVFALLALAAAGMMGLTLVTRKRKSNEA